MYSKEMSSSQTIVFADPANIAQLQTLTTNETVSITTQTVNATTVQGNQVFVGGVQIINSPNKVFQAL